MDFLSGSVHPASCAERHVAYAVYSPLCGGWLTGKYGRGRPYPAGSRMTQRPEPYSELATEATFAALGVLGQFGGFKRLIQFQVESTTPALNLFPCHIAASNCQQAVAVFVHY